MSTFVEVDFDPAFQAVIDYCSTTSGSGVADRTKKDEQISTGIRQGLLGGAGLVLANLLTRQRFDHLAARSVLSGRENFQAVEHYDAVKLLQDCKDYFIDYMQAPTDEKDEAGFVGNIKAKIAAVVMPEHLTEWIVQRRQELISSGEFTGTVSPEERDWLLTQANVRRAEASRLQDLADGKIPQARPSLVGP